MLNWINQFNIFCFLDNQQYNATPSAFECLAGVGCKTNIAVQSGNAFNSLKEYSKNKQWLFGHFGYDLKNETEQLISNNLDNLHFADLHFFEPEIVLQLFATTLTIFTNKDANEIFEQIKNYSSANTEDLTENIPIQKRFTKEEYIQTVNAIKQHIARGDCYELNFCQEFYAEGVKINPLTIYKKLSAISPTPFSAYYRHNNNYCICTSPERYLKKENNTLISQPIKGTAKRSKNATEDEQNKNQLLTSQKERSENVMVVDLVRNDLSKICKQGTVKVQELFGIYTFAQVHQMISTIVGEVDETTHWVDMIKATFPMGSMTGAPKKRVMELIEFFEKRKRGLFSGAIGYISPNGNFDFNVVIRSILYNTTNHYLSFTTGGAITFYSDAEKEYEECLLKAEGMMRVVG